MFWGRKVKLVGQISESQNSGTALDLRREAGLWLRSIRERLNLSQRDLASRLD